MNGVIFYYKKLASGSDNHAFVVYRYKYIHVRAYKCTFFLRAKFLCKR